MGVTICELDMTKLILKIHKPTVITEIGPCKIKMTLETKEIIKIVDDDPLLQQQMVDAGQDAVENASKEIAKELKGFDDDAQKALEYSPDRAHRHQVGRRCLEGPPRRPRRPRRQVRQDEQAVCHGPGSLRQGRRHSLKGDLTKMKQGIEDMIGKVADLVHQVKEGKEDAEDATKFITMLKEKIDKRVYTGAALAIDLAGLAGDVWGGAMETKDFAKAPEIIGNVVTCINAVQDGFDDDFKREKK